MLAARILRTTDRTPPQVGWCLYDWANSGFVLLVPSVLMGPYLTTVARAAADDAGLVYPLGIGIPAGAVFAYTVSVSALMQVVLLPVLGIVADTFRNTRRLLLFSALIGAVAATALIAVGGSDYQLGALLFLMANTSFGASIVFYNALLPVVAGPDERAAVSSYGFALGYAGGAVLLGLNVVFLANADALGISTPDAIRVGLASAGVWWGVFTIPAVRLLGADPSALGVRACRSPIRALMAQASTALARARRFQHALVFLAAFLLFSDAIQTVLVMAALYGQEELGLPVSVLTLVILGVQVVAIFGTLGAKILADRIGAKTTVVCSLLLWTGIVLYAALVLRTALEFFVLAALTGMLQGGTQALSRAMYSLLIPRTEQAEYFGLYEVAENGTTWLGPLLFGIAFQVAGSYRAALLPVAVLFVCGTVLLISVNVGAGSRQALASAREAVSTG
jgi:MFS transporter, UMF1 family